MGFEREEGCHDSTGDVLHSFSGPQKRWWLSAGKSRKQPREVRGWRREGNADRVTGMYSPPSSAVSLSAVSVACGLPWSENIKRESLEINSYVLIKLHKALSTVVKSRAIPLCPAWDVNHPLVQRPPTVRAAHP